MAGAQFIQWFAWHQRLPMPLSASTRLGQYEIISPLGAGGMGEVYRARDTKLGRSVAIKVLLGAVATHTDRIARFEIAHGALFVR